MRREARVGSSPLRRTGLRLSETLTSCGPYPTKKKRKGCLMIRSRKSYIGTGSILIISRTRI